MRIRASEFNDEELFTDEDFPLEPCGYDQDCLGLTEFFDRKERAEDMQEELKSYKELLGVK